MIIYNKWLVKTSQYIIFFSINIFYNTIKDVNNILQTCGPPDIKALDEANKAFENAKNNVITELTNIYMYKFNEFINA